MCNKRSEADHCVQLFRTDKLILANCLLDLLASLSWPMPNLLPKSTRIKDYMPKMITADATVV